VLATGRILHTVCGSRRWTEKITSGRPYSSLNELLYTAHRSWWSLGAEAWKEAFSTHGTIVERLRLLGLAPADSETGLAREIELLSDLENEYRDKFGFPLILFVPGIDSPEDGEGLVEGLVRPARRRLANDSGSELRLAAEEQARINRIHLERLIAFPYLNSQAATRS
jgi:2-oxo-4-hydroxy-4-carboxy-5-ureidoimidazoline decarboxylase